MYESTHDVGRLAQTVYNLLKALVVPYGETEADRYYVIITVLRMCNEKLLADIRMAKQLNELGKELE